MKKVPIDTESFNCDKLLLTKAWSVNTQALVDGQVVSECHDT